MSQFMDLLNPNTDFSVAQDIHFSLEINTATNTRTAAITDKPILIELNRILFLLFSKASSIELNENPSKSKYPSNS